ncbi:alpha-2-macroglobulin family protein [Myroides sp.]|uniref:alpha-2-macroglobulin family protein n=1 Tax=Myroides sp. TaxID=1874736 RepID=UPI003F3E53ED
MKKIGLYLMILAPIVGFGQSSNGRIQELWNIIHKQEENAEVKSMLPNVKEVLLLSKKNKDYSSMMKAMFYEAKINILIEEDNKFDVNTVLDLFIAESNKTTGTSKAILDTYIAEIYNMYYTANKYKLRGRTSVEGGAKASIEYWTEEDFKREIDKYYQRGLTIAARDKTAVIGGWADVFYLSASNLTIDWKKFTVYDALRLNYIENLQHNSFNLTDQERKVIKEKREQLQTELLKDVLATGDQAMYVYIEMYLTASNGDSEVIKEKYASLLKDYPKEPFLYEGYAKYLKGIELITFIDKAIQLFPGTKTAENLLAEKKYAEGIRLNYSVNEYVLDEQAIPVSIGHQNIDKVYVKILKNTNASKEVDEFYSFEDKGYYALEKEMPTVTSYELKLGEFKDYEMHRTIAALKPLVAGRYYVVFSSVPFDQIKENASDVQISHINVTPNVIVVNQGKLRAYDRKSGKPLSNTKIHISNESERRDNSNYWETVITTDSNGDATIDVSKLGSYLFMNIKDEKVYYSPYVSTYYNNSANEDEVTYKATILTDRAIYRPSQVLYFKSIVGKKTKLSEQVFAKAKVTVVLSDANGNEVSKQELMTNEFGSVNGQFVLPANGRLGNYEIEVKINETNAGWHNVLVEEYKRPKFEVVFDEPKAIYKLNEEVEITGKAKAFLGSNIDNAKVVYRVERQEIWPRWICGPSFPYHYDRPETMTQGETVTDASGNFTVKFTALPKEGSVSTLARTFSYNIYADVIDQNGETHSSTQTVVVGEKNIELAIELPVVTSAKELSNFSVSTKNLNGVDYPSQGELTIYPLIAPTSKRITDKFNLNEGDYQLYNYAEFVALFPNLTYGDEADSDKWKEGASVFNTSFDTAKNSKITYEGAKDLPSGNYMIKGYVLENGVKNEVEKKIVFRNEELKEVSTVLVELKTKQKTYQAGDKATIEVRSAEDNTYVYVEVQANGKILTKKVMKVGKKGSNLDISIKQDYKKVTVSALALKHNIAAQDGHEVALKGEESKLQLVIESFRDKVEPGAKEKWSLKVKGQGKEQVIAELLATMYDESLDQFTPHNLDLGLKEPKYYYELPTITKYDFSTLNGTGYFRSLVNQQYDRSMAFAIDRPMVLNTYGFNIFGGYGVLYGSSARMKGQAVMMEGDANKVFVAAPTVSKKEDIREDVPMAGAPEMENSKGDIQAVGSESKAETNNVTPVRKNLRETAFFYPTLKTDENGDVKFEFTMPEALTKWKFMAVAHTKNLEQAYAEKSIVTQKELMVIPNLPRFLREGDKLTLSTKVVNLSDVTRKGKATLQLHNAYSNELLVEKVVDFLVNKDESSAVNWDIEVPTGVEVVSCRVVAVSDNYSDGEESVVPVLSNRILVTETMPIYVKEGQNKQFTFKDYEKNSSNTLQNHKLTLELTTNPIWNAVFALPYLQESVYDSSEQVFGRVFANAVATKILNDNPKIKTVFDQWNVKGEVASKLEQNQELKNILLAETPWAREAANEVEQMKRMAVLFDLNTMQNELSNSLNKLTDLQNADGGFSWFKGGKSDIYMTQSIVEGFGTLRRMGVLDNILPINSGYKTMLNQAIEYMDQVQYNSFVEQAKFGEKGKVTSIGTHYLYTRSFFIGEYGINEKYSPMITAIRKSIESEKPSNNLYQDAMRAVIAKRFGVQKIADNIVKGLLETAVQSDEMGMYWKNNTAGWLWYQAPVETQVAIIEAANEVDQEKYSNAIEQMKVWLLKNKQTTGWASTKSTTKAVYALLNTGKSLIDTEKGIEVKVGGYPINTTETAQMGRGYIKQNWSKAEMTAKKGVVELTKTSPGIAYGAMYWQYFEDLDAINAAETGIKMNKKLYVKANTDKGQVLREITKETPVKVGDVVTVRLEINVDRDMDYVHLKDMRASGFEPTNVLSGYRWKGEFGYYEETRDASTNFFISRLRKGSYVFEYDLRANVSGNFSNGITTMQSMYAPELSAHSEGVRVEIKN